MDLSPQFLRQSLHCVDLDGWNSDAGRQLLDHVRRAVVVPVVRRSGLRGPAADQAEASGWEAAWDALRRPTARTAENPGGMVWVAVRRAVAAEVESARILGGGSVDAMAQEPAQVTSAAPDLGPVVAAVLDGLVEAGWARADAADAIEIMADHAAGGGAGSPTTRWRWVSLRLGVPEWQARRLAALLLGGGESAGGPGARSQARDVGPGGSVAAGRPCARRPCGGLRDPVSGSRGSRCSTPTGWSRDGHGDAEPRDAEQASCLGWSHPRATMLVMLTAEVAR